MLFTEFYFIFYFLPMTLAIFALLPRLEERLLFLFLASLFFYGVWDVRFLPLLLGSIVFNWWLGEKIEDSSDDKKRKRLNDCGRDGTGSPDFLQVLHIYLREPEPWQSI